jgi:hypothetical protein
MISIKSLRLTPAHPRVAPPHRMRNLLLVALCLACPLDAHISEPSPQQTPQSIAVQFSADANTEFALSNGRLKGVTSHVGRLVASFSLDGCTELKNVRFDTIRLVRDDLRQQDPRDSFTLLFGFGSETDRHHGQLPTVQLSFDGGNLTDALVTRPTGESSSISSALCPGRNVT